MEKRQDPALEAVALSHSFKQHKALDAVSFTVDAGSIHGFVGPNGAGKTTTLKIAATLLRPKGGTVRVFGMDVRTLYKTVRCTVGFMPDYFSVYRQMTVFEYLDFFAAAYGMSPAERDRVIGDVLQLTDMEGRKDDLISGLSRGMQQRVGLARVLVHDPKLLLLDEPASGLDPRARIELMEILRELRRMGKTVFISSHILSELADLCDSVTILDRGSVRFSGPMEALLEEADAGEEARYMLQLRAALPGLPEALAALPGVSGVEAIEETPRYRIACDPQAAGPNEILQAAIAAGGEVLSFSMDRKHLNQAFMDLTRPGVNA